MKITDLNKNQKDQLNTLLNNFFSKYLDIFAVTVCTSDGFDLCSVIEGSIQKTRLLEADKISAMSSTMCSLSTAASNHILDSDLQNTTIEAEDGSNVILLKVSFIELECVIFAAATDKVSLAELRFITKQLANGIEKVT